MYRPNSSSDSPHDGCARTPATTVSQIHAHALAVTAAKPYYACSLDHSQLLKRRRRRSYPSGARSSPVSYNRSMASSDAADRHDANERASIAALYKTQVGRMSTADIESQIPTLVQRGSWDLLAIAAAELSRRMEWNKTAKQASERGGSDTGERH